MSSGDQYINDRFLFCVVLICADARSRHEYFSEGKRSCLQTWPLVRILRLHASEKEYYTLNSGHKIPSFGLGTWLSKPGEVGKAVEQALKNGYKLIDCARMYHNEDEIGQTLERCFKEGVVKREDIFITSKLWFVKSIYYNVVKWVHQVLVEQVQ